MIGSMRVMQRGANKGKQRGAPLRAYPCYWAREAKVQPLQKVSKEADISYIGIAADESHRVGKADDPAMLRIDTRLWNGAGLRMIVSNT